ncbi:MOP flippase family protein [Rouxiella silvae]|uniref:MOP flippase family protein n=1 Tax=Rouxiella silvae TaxID=1646373 RepID=A0AA40X0E4_9GAMM|nr:MOP flippase family protein [Rouxiella silvae]KQN43717.1 polysaccharide biosynthesis protein [Serratia sp. Leaf50]MBF6636233.1 MOP flippase family protein [Rouxiella silvae]
MGLFNNVKWVSISQITKIFSQVIGMFIFARFLTPQQIGIMSMALVVVNFANILRDLGSSAAIIQKEHVSEQLKNSVFYLNALFGFLLFALVFVFSSSIAEFFKEPDLALILKCIAISFPINSMTSVHLALLERDSKFNKIAFVEVLSSVTSLLIAIYLSTQGAGVYSLVAQTLLYSFLSALGFWIFSSWFPGKHFSFNDISSIFKFTSNLIGFNFINYFSRNCDQIIIGKFFSSSILGQYSLAYRIMLFPIQNITFVLTRSLYPLLSRLQDSKAEAFKIYMSTIKLIAVIIPPLMLGLSSVSHDFVLFFFGEKWSSVAAILILLAPTAILQAMVSTTGSVFMSQGKTNVLLMISIFNAVLQIGSFIIGSFFDIHTLIKLYLVANIFMFIPNMFLAIKMLNGSFYYFVKSIYKPIFCAILMYVMVQLLSAKIGVLGLSLISKLIVEILFGALMYVILLSIVEWSFVSKKVMAKFAKNK